MDINNLRKPEPGEIGFMPRLFAFLAFIWLVPIIVMAFLAFYILIRPINYLLSLRKNNED
mgnify:CR=1 FL=1